MSKVLCPGSYDPITLGHIDIIKRCSSVFNEVIVAVGVNENKKTMMSIQNRIVYAKDALKDFGNVTVISYENLTTDLVYEKGVDFIVKGIRNTEDYKYENEMAYVNAEIALEKYGKRIETLYLNCSPEYQYHSSSLVRNMIELNLNVEKYVHDSALLHKLLNK